MKTKLIYLLFIYFFFYCSALNAADFSTGREGEILRPLDSANVTLLKEEITINVGTKKADFFCKTHVKNLGPGVEMFVGYPAEEILAGEKTTQTFRDFFTYIEGKIVPIMETNSEYEEALPDNPKYNKWFLWPIILDSGQTKEVTNVFWTENKYDSVGNAVTGFVLKPVEYWKGTPQEITLKYNFDAFEPYAIISAFPANYHFEEDTLVFKFCNEKPTNNIKISFNPDYEFQLAGLPNSEIKEFWEIKSNKEYEEGLKLIADYMKDSSLTPEALNALMVQKGIILFDKGEIKKAEKVLQQTLDKQVSFSAVYYLLAKIYALNSNSVGLDELYSNALLRRINPLILRKIESFLPEVKRIYLPEFTTINPSDISRFTAEIEDKNSDIKKISLLVWEKKGQTTKILLKKDINLHGQSYRYYINENIKIPIYVDNAYSKLTIYDGSGQIVEKTLPLTNRKNKLLKNANKKESYSLINIFIIFLVAMLIMKFAYKKIIK